MPGQDSMLNIQPNPDKSFTCLLITKKNSNISFESLKKFSDFENYFFSNFPLLRGKIPNLEEQFNRMKIGNLIEIKCYPWTFKNSCLIGDAAHPILPFLEQGANCAFEDCEIFCNFLDECGSLPLAALKFQYERKVHTDVIQDMSRDNMIQLKENLSQLEFAEKKLLVNVLNNLYSHMYKSYRDLLTSTSKKYSEVKGLMDTEEEILNEMVLLSNENTSSKIPMKEIEKIIIGKLSALNNSQVDKSINSLEDFQFQPSHRSDILNFFDTNVPRDQNQNVLNFITGELSEQDKAIISILKDNITLQLNDPQSLKDVSEKALYKDRLCLYQSISNQIFNELQGIKGIQPIRDVGGIHIMIQLLCNEFEDIKNDIDFSEKLYLEQSIKVMPGSFFSAPEYIRIVVCQSSKNVDDFIRGLKEFCWRHSINNSLVKFQSYQKYMLSKRTDQAQYIYEPRFLLEGHDFDKIAYPTFVRVGSNMLQYMIDWISGVYSASDFKADFMQGSEHTSKYSDEIASCMEFTFKQGLKGKFSSPNKVFLSKTHYPYFKFMKNFQCQRIIVVVRNPFDVIVSNFNLLTTFTHNKQNDKRLFQQFPEEWDSFIKEMCADYRRFYEFWLGQSCPSHFVRYEDMLTKPKESLEEVFKFILKTNNMEGTLIQQRIEEFKKSGKKLYDPRSGQILGELGCFTTDQINYVKDQLSDILHNFEYFQPIQPIGYLAFVNENEKELASQSKMKIQNSNSLKQVRDQKVLPILQFSEEGVDEKAIEYAKFIQHCDHIRSLSDKLIIE